MASFGHQTSRSLLFIVAFLLIIGCCFGEDDQKPPPKSSTESSTTTSSKAETNESGMKKKPNVLLYMLVEVSAFVIVRALANDDNNDDDSDEDTTDSDEDSTDSDSDSDDDDDDNDNENNGGGGGNLVDRRNNRQAQFHDMRAHTNDEYEAHFDAVLEPFPGLMALEEGGEELHAFDRKKHIFKLAQGEYVAPETKRAATAKATAGRTMAKGTGTDVHQTFSRGDPKTKGAATTAKASAGHTKATSSNSNVYVW